MAIRLLARLHPRTALQRRTVRVRLALLYGSLFVVSGAALLVITYLLVKHTFPVIHQDFTEPGTGSIVGGIPLPSGQTKAPNNPSALATLVSQQRSADLHQLLTKSMIALTVMGIVSLALGWLVAGRVLRPLLTMTSRTQQISEANLHERLALSGPRDELTDLGDTIDGLLGRLEAAFKAQRLFVANASHELLTPLARQRTLIELGLADPGATTNSLRTNYERVLAANEEQERLIQGLLALARSERGIKHRDPIDLAATTLEIIQTRRLQIDAQKLQFKTTLDPATVSGDPRLIERLIVNIIDNAIHHNVTNGTVEVATTTGEDYTTLSVDNTGPIIQAQEVSRIFLPFQQLGADRTGKRNGLGLSIVQAIVIAHQANITTTAKRDGGLKIDVGFPTTLPQPRLAPHASTTTGNRYRPRRHRQ